MIACFPFLTVFFLMVNITLFAETERLTGGGTTTLCSANSCPPYAKCIPGKKGDKQCICPSCSHNGKKVCGSDGKTYRDVCELKKYSCKVNHFVKVMSHGECDEGKTFIA